LPTYRLNEKEKILQDKYIEIYPDDRNKLSDQEWLLRLTCFLGLNKRYDFILSESDVFACVHKEVRGELPNLKDLSPADLNELPKLWRDEKKEAFYSTLSEHQKSIFDRLEYELTVVHLMGFDGYFVIVADFI
jgi:DNA polymerase III alpha subunit